MITRCLDWSAGEKRREVFDFFAGFGFGTEKPDIMDTYYEAGGDFLSNHAPSATCTIVKNRALVRAE